jgi:Family of unknown function (DUF6599)
LQLMMGIVAKRLALGFALGAVPILAWAGQSNVIPLTTTSRWHLASSQKLPVASLKDWGGDPSIEAEYGVTSLALRTYTLYPEDESVKVLVEDASDVSSAYGLFTLYRDDSMTSLNGLPLTDVGEASAVMARGRTFFRILEPGATSSTPGGPGADQHAAPRQFPFTLHQLQTLLILVGGPGPTPDDLRALPSPLPAAGLVRGSEKYLLGQQGAKRVLPDFRADLIGFSQGAEARLATYRSGNAKVQVLAVTYPTPQIARERFETMEKLLGVNDAKAASPVYGKLTGSFVILVMNSGTANIAARVLGNFKSTSSITWNERYPGDQSLVIQVVRLVLANLIFSFILAGFGLAGGILFFGSKYIARKWFPKSLWGQPDEATIIKLNLQ